MDKKDIIMEIYKSSEERLTNEIKQFFIVNSVFLLLLSSLSGIVFWTGEVPEEHLFRVTIIGLLISIIWFCSNLSATMWKRWWEARNELIHELIRENIENISELKTAEERLQKKFTPKIFWVPLRVTFFISLLPVLFIAVFLYVVLGESCFSMFLFIILALIAILIYGSYFYKPKQKATNVSKSLKK